MTRTTNELLASYSSEVNELASAARRSLLAWLPGAEETVDTTAPVLGYGYGPGYKGVVCTLLLSKSGVKIGIARGAELHDPHQLLEGSGKVHRYVQLRTVSDLNDPALKELVKTAHRAWKARGNQ